MSHWPTTFAESDGEQIDPFEVGELLTSLTEKSLVSTDEATGRYRLLETVQDYARVMLAGFGEVERERGRHLSYFAQLAAEAEPHLKGSDRGEWLDRLENEHDNFRSALDWSCQAGVASHEEGLRLASALLRFWESRGHLTVARHQLGPVLALPVGTDTATRANLLHGAARFAILQGDFDSAHELVSESISIYRRLGNRSGLGSVLNTLGIVTHERGDPVAALAHFEQSLEIARESGNRMHIANALMNLGYVASEVPDYAAARSFWEESLSIHREIGNRTGISRLLGNLGTIALLQGDHAAASTLLHECLSIFVDLGDRLGTVSAITDVAWRLSVQGSPELAARLWGSAERLREELGIAISPADRPQYDRQVEDARARAGKSEFDAAWQQGRAMTLEEAVALALS
jgi:non-specific serine/threonine protein kinase